MVPAPSRLALPSYCLERKAERSQAQPVGISFYRVVGYRPRWIGSRALGGPDPWMSLVWTGIVGNVHYHAKKDQMIEGSKALATCVLQTYKYERTAGCGADLNHS
ncbi:hypothetical protein VTK73DRAFT_2664 [Phialemonium thermophilum]|uniref:Uncharacterized protein n=1 Tax=Phialemonium thermophilum TaxID=223376 RepID=A0ABR3VRM3_9PEZI